MSDFEHLRPRDSTSISATGGSGNRTVKVFIWSAYYGAARHARQKGVEEQSRVTSVEDVSVEGRGTSGGMSQSGLEAFGAYQKATQLFDLVLADMEALKANPLCYRLVSLAGRADACGDGAAVRKGRVSREEIMKRRLAVTRRGSAPARQSC
jgi:hypothetical protein